MSAHFPPEIFEAILSYLSSDIQTLRACSLTCSSLTGVARNYLFRRVGLFPLNHVKFLSLVQPLSPQSRLSDNVGKYVRSLTVLEGKGNLPFERPFFAESLPLLSSQLPGVTSLSLKDIEWKRFASVSGSVDALLGGFEHVIDLTLSRMRFSNFEACAGLVASFPALERLSCESVWIDPRGISKASPHNLTLPPNLRSFKMGSCIKRLFIDWILASGNAVKLQEIELLNIQGTDAASVERLLTSVGSHLRHLSLEMEPVVAETLGTVNDISLATNTSLNSLSIYIPHLSLNGGYALHPIRLLEQVTASTLETVHFAVSIVDPEELGRLHWDQLSELLGHESWQTSLKTIRWTFVSNYAMTTQLREEVQRYVSDRLFALNPSVAARLAF